MTASTRLASSAESAQAREPIYIDPAPLPSPPRPLDLQGRPLISVGDLWRIDYLIGLKLTATGSFISPPPIPELIVDEEVTGRHTPKSRRAA